MAGRQDEVLKQHEGKVMMQKDLEAAREEVARMAKEVDKASEREGELKEEVEKLRQGMHQILESVREQVGKYSCSDLLVLILQDGQSDVMVTAPALETLLTILDARHYYGEHQHISPLCSFIFLNPQFKASTSPTWV